MDFASRLADGFLDFVSWLADGCLDLAFRVAGGLSASAVVFADDSLGFASRVTTGILYFTFQAVG